MSKYWVLAIASRKLRASALPDCSKTAVGTCLTSVLMAQPKMKSIATGTARASTRANMSRLRWLNSFAIMPRSREPTLGCPERPQLLAQPRLALLVHEGDEQVFDRGLDVVDPARRQPGAREELAHVGRARVLRAHHDAQARADADDLLHGLPVGQEVRRAAQIIHLHL